MDARWPAGRTYELEGLRVELSAPVPVGRSADFFWYPEIIRFPGGNLAAIVRLGADTHDEDDAVLSWSNDGGLTWGEHERFSGQSTDVAKRGQITQCGKTGTDNGDR